MDEYQLFFGFPVQDSYQRELNQLPAAVIDLYIQNQNSSYLQQIEYEGISYLGKWLGAFVEMSSLDAMQVHIFSLLKLLIPHYPFEKNSLMLLYASRPS
jgi:hypothetical protein